MTDVLWQKAIAAFDEVAPADVPIYQEAIADVQRLGVSAFADLLFVELIAAHAAIHIADVVTDEHRAVAARLAIRKTVLVEWLGSAQHDALMNFQGRPQ